MFFFSPWKFKARVQFWQGTHELTQPQILAVHACIVLPQTSISFMEQFTQKWKFSNNLLIPMLMGSWVNCLSPPFIAKQCCCILRNNKKIWVLYKKKKKKRLKKKKKKLRMAPYSSSGIIQVSGCPETPNLYENTLFTPFLSQNHHGVGLYEMNKISCPDNNTNHNILHFL